MPTEFRLDCPTCARPRPFEQPPCADGHGSECPERVCMSCGTALLVGSLPGPDQTSVTRHGTGRRAA